MTESSVRNSPWYHVGGRQKSDVGVRSDWKDTWFESGKTEGSQPVFPRGDVVLLDRLLFHDCIVTSHCTPRPDGRVRLRDTVGQEEYDLGSTWERWKTIKQRSELIVILNDSDCLLEDYPSIPVYKWNTGY